MCECCSCKKEELPVLEIRYHDELYGKLERLLKLEQGDFIDMRAAERTVLQKGECKAIPLGVSIRLPKGYWGQIVPRSSLYKHYGLICANSFAVIDESYSGDSDIWHFLAYATCDTIVEKGDRLCQFRIVKKNDFYMIEVEKLDEVDRGGFGSTGIR